MLWQKGYTKKKLFKTEKMEAVQNAHLWTDVDMSGQWAIA